jgi:hypothetical protein
MSTPGPSTSGSCRKSDPETSDLQLRDVLDDARGFGWVVAMNVEHDE